MATKELAQELERQIQKAALDGALTEDAVNQFHSIVTERDALKGKVNELDRALVNTRAERDDWNTQFMAASQELGLYKKREGELVEREKKITELELTAKYQEQRAKDHVHMVGLIFRNSVLKKGVMTPGHSSFDQYGTRHQDYPDNGTVEEEET